MVYHLNLVFSCDLQKLNNEWMSGQRAESREEKAEIRSRRSEVGNLQSSFVNRHWSLVIGQRGRRSEIGGQRSEICNR